MLQIPDVVKGLLILICVFVPFEKIFAIHKYNLLREGWITDLCYYFSGYFIGRGTAQVVTMFTFLSQDSMPTLLTFMSQKSIGWQVFASIVIGDLSFYFAHRLLHTVPWLWRFHAIHHSSTHIDWLATVRVHPLEQVFTKTCQMIPLYWLGFSTEALAIYAIFSSAIAFFIHANIRVSFPILKWIIATPEFHHWHHDQVSNLGTKNFAVQLPIIDYIFGTYYMPKGELPTEYGTKLETSTNYFSYLVYPFKNVAKNSFK